MTLPARTEARATRWVCRSLPAGKNDQKGRGDQFTAPLAGAVGVPAAHGVYFAAAQPRFPVLIALVAGDIDGHPDAGGMPHGFQHIHRAHDIGGISQPRLLVGEAHQGLGRQMKNQVRGMQDWRAARR